MSIPFPPSDTTSQSRRRGGKDAFKDTHLVAGQTASTTARKSRNSSKTHIILDDDSLTTSFPSTSASAFSSARPSTTKRPFGRSMSSNSAIPPTTSNLKAPSRDRKISAMFAPASKPSHIPLSTASSRPASRVGSLSRTGSLLADKGAKSKPIVLDDLDEIDEIFDGDNDLQTLMSAAPQRIKTHASQSGSTTTSSSQANGSITRKPGFFSSRMFISSEPGKQKPPDPTITSNSGPWTDLFGPRNLTELAVHKKKVDDVRSWLDGVINQGDRQRLLVLKGSAGSGKTATLALLAEELGIRLIEWKTPPVDAIERGYVSAAGKLEDFLSSASRYGSLTLSTQSSTGAAGSNGGPESHLKEAIVMEEFLFSSNTINAFRNVVLSFLEANTPTLDDVFHGRANAVGKVTPLIMVITESNLSTAAVGRDNDNFTAYRLLGPEILAHPSTAVIEFNPIASTFMQKALDLVLRRACTTMGRTAIPGDAVLQQLSQIGDIRSAIASLQFIYLSPDPANFSGRLSSNPNKRKRGGNSPALGITKAEERSLRATSLRESTLGIFHAVGKVVYNNRVDPATLINSTTKSVSSIIGEENPYFPQHNRPLVPEYVPDQLMAELGTDLQTFVGAIQENYLLSCTHDFDPDATSECMAVCMDYLSLADILAPSLYSGAGNGRAGRSKRFGSAVDDLRQEEMSFNLAVRGIMFTLPSPVQRVAPPPILSATLSAVRSSNRSSGSGTGPLEPSKSGTGSFRKAGGNGEASKIFFPTSLRIWRMVEEVDDLVDMMLSRVVAGKFCPNSRTGPVPSYHQYTESPQRRKRPPGGGGVVCIPSSGSYSDSSFPHSSYPSQPPQSQTQLDHNRTPSSGLNPNAVPSHGNNLTGEEDIDPQVLSRTVSRNDMLLDILPYSMIIRSVRLHSYRRDPLRDKLSAELYRASGLLRGPPGSIAAAVSTTAIIVPKEGWDLDEANTIGGLGATKYTGPNFASAEGATGNALILSDDDIED